MALTSREIYWPAILADFRRSGLTHVEFCHLRRISLHSFRKWLYHLRPGLPPKATRAHFCCARKRRARRSVLPRNGQDETADQSSGKHRVQHRVVPHVSVGALSIHAH